MRHVIILSALIITITVAIYWQASDHEFLNYDDNVYVTGNTHVSKGITGSGIIWAFTSVAAANWHPVTWLSHMVDVQLYGMNPHGHHLTNIIIHTISTVLLLFFLFRVTGSVWQSSFVAALFALHPLHVESVAWIAERKDVLNAFFCFMTLLLYSTYVLKRKPALYLSTLFTFILGLMTKPMLVTLPAVMLLLDYWPLNRINLNEESSGNFQQSGMKSQLLILLKEKIPFFLSALLSSGITIYAQHRGGAIKSFDVIPIGFRLENASISYVKYIVKTLWPHDLAVFYPLPSSLPYIQVVSSLLILLLISAASIWVGRRYPFVPVGWFWYIFTLIPVIGIVQVGAQSMADRYTYIPQIGLFIMAAWGVPVLVKHLKYRQGILVLLAGAVLSASSALTWRQLGYWRDNISLYSHAIRVTNGNDLAHYNLGFALDEKGELDDAITEYRETLIINPNHIAAHNNLGFALDRKGDFDGAITEYKSALAIYPKSTATHYNLGLVFDEKRDTNAAMKEFQEALTISPDFYAAHYNLGVDFAKKGDFDSAVREYQETLTINPNHFAAHYNLGFFFAGKGDLNAAIREFQEAVRINPSYSAAHNNLGSAFEQKGDLEAAIREFRSALTLNPDFFDAHNNLGVALQQKGDMDEAIREYREAIRVNPTENSASKNLRVALVQRKLELK